jgi:hypothetical protein
MDGNIAEFAKLDKMKKNLQNFFLRICAKCNSVCLVSRFPSCKATPT